MRPGVLRAAAAGSARNGAARDEPAGVAEAWTDAAAVPTQAATPAQLVLAGVVGAGTWRGRANPLLLRSAAAAGLALGSVVRSVRLALNSDEFELADELPDPSRHREAEREVDLGDALDTVVGARPMPEGIATAGTGPHKTPMEPAARQPAPARRSPKPRRVNPVRRTASQRRERGRAAKAWRVVAWGVSLLATLAMAAAFWLIAAQSLTSADDEPRPAQGNACRGPSSACRR
jgi:hypothetical protein